MTRTHDLPRSVTTAQYIYDHAPFFEMRSGQLLFNSLRHEIALVVRTTDFDPFYKNLEVEEIVEWLDNHILYDNQGRMVRLYDGHKILWQEEEEENG